MTVSLGCDGAPDTARHAIKESASGLHASPAGRQTTSKTIVDLEAQAVALQYSETARCEAEGLL